MLLLIVPRRFVHLTRQRWQQLRPRIKFPEPAGEHALAGTSTTVLRDLPVTANLTKDVLLYSFDKKPFFTYMTIFGALQLIFWGQMAFLNIEMYKRQQRRLLAASPAAAPAVSSSSTDASPLNENAKETKTTAAVLDTEEDNRWYVKYLQKVGMMGAKYPAALGITYLLIGCAITYGTWFFALRSVHMLVLLKGGRNVSVTTFGPFGRLRAFTVPLSQMTSSSSRTSLSGYMRLKVKNRISYFLMDKRGVFHNPQLFDVTAGLSRRIS
ncbi:hypothetical protein RvY_11107 [Ramazzottius varieornatus]|uniref:Transmembrane protein 223 n=1 Tax=Ramazzottius varieornatus TaxID=947166 RepID=A0A1D1VF06_RAMVA|nr:hypothetical protein RvY_11107 [Ramazzottius varieornatus]